MGIDTVLLERGVITEEDLARAADLARQSGEPIDQALVRLGVVTREQVLRAIGAQFHMEIVDLSEVDPDPQVLGSLPASLVYRQKCVPIGRDNGTLTIATSDPFDLSALDELRLLTGCSIELVLADERELTRFVRKHYGVGGDTLDEMAKGSGPEIADGSTDEIELAQEASVIKLVNDVIVEAIGERATDVHIEPYEDELVVRYRIDGVPPARQRPPPSTRLGRGGSSRASRSWRR
ncbi:MAG: hypothetical protein R3B49_03785 [Phycisphaerales bacterium]